jgi:hypothetical protein
MIIIRPTFWRRSNTIYAVVIGAFCLSPLVFQPSDPFSLVGLATSVVQAV